MADLGSVIEVLKKKIPDAQIEIDTDTSDLMRLHNGGVSYEMDNTVAHEDFGYETKYLLKDMVEDFVNEVRAGRSG